jgi:hypothetical protein
MNSINKSLLAAITVACFVTVGAHADTISGQLWHVPEATTLNAIPANVPGTTPDVTFDVLSPMNFFGTGVSVGTWLGNGSAFNIAENTAGTLASLMDNGTVGTMLRFSGFVTVANGQTFTVTHDDGLTLIINGINLGLNPGPTAPITSTATYTGPSGTFAFDLVYAECCGGPAVLQVDLPFSNSSTVPDAGCTLAMLGGALTMLGTVARRFRK